jgi:adenylate kinase family enzyme
VNRILVVGTTGSGKTTVASTLASYLGAPHVELDALHWEPGWVEAVTEEFRDRALAAASGDRWVLCGNYWTKLGDVLWARADTVVWLDLPLPILLWRLIRRTISRSLRKTQLWGSNQERISGLWSKDSLLLWAIKSHPRNRARYAAALADPRWQHIAFVRLRSQHAVREWLGAVRRKTMAPDR